MSEWAAAEEPGCELRGGVLEQGVQRLEGWVWLVGLLVFPYVVRALPDWLEGWRDRWYFKRAGLDDVREMSGLEFEKYLEHLFRRLGYRVERTPYQNDYGIDLILTDEDGTRTAVQAKRWKWKVGVKAVQEAVAGAVYYDCDEKMVVTTSYFTKEAIQMAEQTETELWGVRELAEAMAEANGHADEDEDEVVPVREAAREAAGRRVGNSGIGMPVPRNADHGMQATRRGQAAPTCPQCGAEMRSSDKGGREWWVCSRYPACQGYRRKQ